MYMDKYCAQENVDKDRMLLRIFHESSFRMVKVWEKKIKAYSYGYGCMTLGSAMSIDPCITEEDLMNPEKNVEISVKFAAKLSKMYGGNWDKVISHWVTGKPDRKPKLVAIENQRVEELKKISGGV